MPLNWSNFKHTKWSVDSHFITHSFIQSLTHLFTHFTYHFALKVRFAICFRNSFLSNFVLIVLILCFNQYVLMFFLTRTTNYAFTNAVFVHVISKPSNEIEQHYIAFRYFFLVVRLTIIWFLFSTSNDPLFIIWWIYSFYYLWVKSVNEQFSTKWIPLSIIIALH